MSGVLQRLAARVIPVRGAVRPRLGSRFEAFTGLVEPGTPESGLAPAAAEARPVHSERAASRAVHSERAASRPVHSERAAARPATVAAPAFAAPESGSRVAELAIPAAPEPLLPRLSDRGDSAPAASAPVAAAAPPFSASGIRAAENRPAAIPPADPVRLDTAPAAVAGQPHRPPEAPPQALPAGDGPPRRSEKSAALADWRETPLLSRRASSAMAFEDSLAPTAAAPPAAAPDIQVSIGRIEIRADRPEIRPPRRAPPRPALMSLEDYLGKRRGRR